jgi:predicted ATP-grasp superfamily ATP-dependent carboligase/SAM-dependent methyltransferase
MNKGVLIISGYNQRAIISFCRFACENSIKFYIVAKDNTDTILVSDYKEYVIATRNNTSLSLKDFEEWAKIIDKEHLLILPSTEYLNRFVLKNRMTLEKDGYVIPLCEEQLYNIISNKYSFGQLCKEHEIDIPLEYNTPTKYPCVVKPKTYSNFSGLILKPEILYSDYQFKQFLTHNKIEDFYFQEFIPGKSVYLLFYFSLDGSVASFSQENLIQQDIGLSIIAARSAAYHLTDGALKYKKLFSDLQFHGLVMVEIRLHDNKYYMIEANPRLWGPSQLILDAGMDIFHRFMADYGLMKNNELSKSYCIGKEYFWSGGISQDSRNEARVVFHGNYNPEKFIHEYYKFYASDIYFKEDTMSIFIMENKGERPANDIEILKDLYSKMSKHSHYQKLPSDLRGHLNEETLLVNSRYEDERLSYITKHLNIKNKMILDVGANTGFFSFELIKAGAKRIFPYEGNKAHADFMTLASKVLKINDKITVVNKYYSFNNESNEEYDIILLLNVLHHIGDDYGDISISIQQAKQEILRQINSLSNQTSFVVFQLGFNWKGNRNNCLFENGTKKELIDFVVTGTSKNWSVEKIGIAEKSDSIITYKDLNDNNIERDDALGEFLNRPIFILKSIKNRIILQSPPPPPTTQSIYWIASSKLYCCSGSYYAAKAA